MFGEMGTSWRTSLAVVITFLQIQALICNKPTVVSGTEGQMFDFRCEYPNDWNNKSKFFCCFDIEESFVQLIRTSNHNESTTEARVSLYDNNTAGFFIVRVDKLSLKDSGMYWWGADGSNHIRRIYLNVSQVNKIPASTMDVAVPKVTLQLFLTMILCIGAMMFVCLFTICLLLAAKNRRPTPHQRRETSSDYETMMPTARAAPEPCCRCSHPDGVDLSALPLPPSDLYSRFTEEHRESIISCSLGEYVDVDVPGRLCQYQHLDRSRLEEHVYHSLHGSSSPKQRAPKELIFH